MADEDCSVMWNLNRWIPPLRWHGTLESSGAAIGWTEARRWGRTTGLWLVPARPASDTAAPRTPASGWARSAPRGAAGRPGASRSPGKDGSTRWLWSRCWGRRRRKAGRRPATSSARAWTCQLAKPPAYWRSAKLTGAGTVQRWQSPATGLVPSGRRAWLSAVGSSTRGWLTEDDQVAHWEAPLGVKVLQDSGGWPWAVTDLSLGTSGRVPQHFPPGYIFKSTLKRQTGVDDCRQFTLSLFGNPSFLWLIKTDRCTACIVPWGNLVSQSLQLINTHHTSEKESTKLSHSITDRKLE